MRRTEVGIDPHQDLVNFLKDQMEMGSEPVLSDPIGMTRRELIELGEGSQTDGVVTPTGGEGLAPVARAPAAIFPDGMADARGKSAATGTADASPDAANRVNQPA